MAFIAFGCALPQSMNILSKPTPPHIRATVAHRLAATIPHRTLPLIIDPFRNAINVQRRPIIAPLSFSALIGELRYELDDP